MQIKQKLFQTTDSFALTLLRIGLALVVLPHGAQKLLGWFGGYGFSGTMNYFTDTMGLPWLISLAVIILESIGAFLLIAGVGTRIMAGLYTVLALGIMFTSHASNGFFMNWFGNQAGEGFEYFIFWITISLALMFTGGGKWSLDKYLSQKS